MTAISDLHVEAIENRRFVEQLRPAHDGDWLIVCGDVGETMSDIEWALERLACRFEKVIWTPGNHELWTCPDDEVQLRGEQRYLRLVDFCRRLEISTPEDPYPMWCGTGGPLVIAPIFTLYDYSFGANIATTKEEALARARAAGVMCSDEFVLHPDPYPTMEQWCHQRLRLTEERLTTMVDCGTPAVLVSHFPLLQELTSPLFRPEFAQWCGTVRTDGWHTRFGAQVVVYGHLHIPRSTVHDGVRFEEVSFGYPLERARGRGRPAVPRPVITNGVRT